MAVEFKLPALSPTMELGTLIKWIVSDGATVDEGDVIAEIETDKAIMEATSPAKGVIHFIVSAGIEDIPVGSLIAVITEKGETFDALQYTTGHPKAEVKPAAVESKPIPIETDLPSTVMTVRDALRTALDEEMARDEKVYLMGEDVAQYNGAFKVSRNLLEKYGSNRVVDSPISEHAFTGMAVGASIAGLRPIIEYMTMNFSLQAVDQIVNAAASLHYMTGGAVSCPIVFRGPNGVSAGAGASHSQDLTAMYALFPGLKVVSPYSPADAKGLLKSAIRDSNPVIFLEHELAYGLKGSVPDSSDWLIPIGKAHVERSGYHITVVSYSFMVSKALKAAEQLSAEGIEMEVINLRTIKPLDIDTIIQSVQKTNRLLIVEEGNRFTGVGAEISAEVIEQAMDWLDAPIGRLNRAEVPLPYARLLEEAALPQVNNIIEKVKKIIR